ncbi:beta-glucuronosyltransferase GlcAT14A [Malania oleifera]|uniref:beta-glucuronosyltransferase GlcAT14A n=1 Tax=Malania oleifera TaxID=397392 RepID=UPI0025ADBE1D|nr:beta-glucuronosyltransferase GlcAT14A [Malania oleifera]
MQNQSQSPVATIPKDNKTLYILLATSLCSLLFIFSLSTTTSQPSSATSAPDPFLFPNRQAHRTLFLNPNPSPDPHAPSIAYLISGSNGDSDRILRILLAAYHPRNFYLLHLDLSASQSERDTLAFAVQSVPIFRAAKNVNVIGKADYAYPKGSSPISSMLHGASILLRLSSAWDWFINLSSRDYPLVTQDDLLHILSFLPKDVNFLNHTSNIGWKESRKLRPIIVDPGLYLLEESEMFFATQKRELPNAYRLYTGSSSAILTRKFVEFCILGSDNLPRTLLMYLSNMPSSLPNYFPTLLCNSPQFNRTIINHNLRYTAFDMRQETRVLNASDLDDMIKSGAAFATPFLPDDPLLDRIDQDFLNRSPGNVVPGGWCLGEHGNDSCAVWGDASVLRPSSGARRLEKRIIELLSNRTFQAHQCKDE